MRTLITGGAGFIGSHLADRLLAQDHPVLVIDNFATGRRDNLKPHPSLTLLEGSIADARLVEQAFAEFQPDQVVHAAAAYKDPADWTEDIRTNVLGTAHVVKAAVRSKSKRLIYFQTALCYGLTPLEQPITLEHPIRPQGSSYAYSKTSGEHYIDLSGIEAITFRLANAYGPRNISGPLPTFFQRLTTDKPCFVNDTRRDFIYIDDLVTVVERALQGKGRKGAYHISTGKDHAIQELYDATLAALGIKPATPVQVRPRNPDDAFTILLDPSRTMSDFDWLPTTPLEAGVAKAISYYQQFGIRETYTHLKAA